MCDDLESVCTWGGFFHEGGEVPCISFLSVFFFLFFFSFFPGGKGDGCIIDVCKVGCIAVNELSGGV